MNLARIYDGPERKWQETIVRVVENLDIKNSDFLLQNGTKSKRNILDKIRAIDPETADLLDILKTALISKQKCIDLLSAEGASEPITNLGKANEFLQRKKEVEDAFEKIDKKFQRRES